ncbi:MAG: hypothetical protein R3C10_20385 [Pirellulales bacterium]
MYYYLSESDTDGDTGPGTQPASRVRNVARIALVAIILVAGIPTLASIHALSAPRQVDMAYRVTKPVWETRTKEYWYYNRIGELRTTTTAYKVQKNVPETRVVEATVTPSPSSELRITIIFWSFVLLMLFAASIITLNIVALARGKKPSQQLREWLDRIGGTILGLIVGFATAGDASSSAVLPIGFRLPSEQETTGEIIPDVVLVPDNTNIQETRFIDCDVLELLSNDARWRLVKIFEMTNMGEIDEAILTLQQVENDWERMHILGSHLVERLQTTEQMKKVMEIAMDVSEPSSDRSRGLQILATMLTQVGEGQLAQQALTEAARDYSETRKQGIYPPSDHWEGGAPISPPSGPPLGPEAPEAGEYEPSAHHEATQTHLRPTCVCERPIGIL